MAIIKSNSLSREEYLRKKRRKKLIRYAVFLTFFIFIFGGLSYTSYRKEFRINEVVLKGGLLVTEKEIKEESMEFMKGSYFWLFPKNNIFIYSKRSLEKNLTDKFKRIETIEISRESLTKIVVEITERKPVAIWCKELQNITNATTTETVDVLQKEECFFIDLYSTIFAPAPNFSGDAYFKYYGLVQKDSPIGEKYIASSTQFTNINNFIDLVKKLDIKPRYLKAKEENEFSLVLFGGGEIYFDINKSLDTAYINLETLLKSPELSGEIINSNLDYIDLRYGNKLFYKLKG